MIEISEKVIVNSLKAGLRVVRENNELFDRIFKRLNITESQKLKQYIKNDTVHITQGYPTNRAKLPCYAVMLGGENEDQHYLGDFSNEIGDASDFYEGDDPGELVIEERLQVRKRGTLVEIITNKKNVVAVTNIADEDGNPLDLKGMEVEDARRGIISIAGTDLVNGEWVDVSYVYKEKGFSSYGAMFQKQYRIEIWSPNGDLVTHLYHLLKWILMFSKPQFYEAGWVDVSLGGADLEPIEGFESEVAFRRAASLSFSIEETYELEEHYIQDIKVFYTGEGGDNDD